MFGRRDAASECFNEINLTLPSGREVTGKVPPLKRAFYFLGLLDLTKNGNNKASLELLDKFPAEVGLETELNELTVEEFFDVVHVFFARRGSVAETEQTESPAENDQEAS